MFLVKDKGIDMIVGVDFDNTLVCYDGLFYNEALARKMIPETAPIDKAGIRHWLIEQGRESDFTLLQGLVYGHNLPKAKPYPGALDCIRRLKEKRVGVFVISHKTRTPQAGPPCDLRRAATEWLRERGVLAPGPLLESEVFFEDTPADKVDRIARLGCTHFIDDLPGIFLAPSFPAVTKKMLFSPKEQNASLPGDIGIFTSWRDMETWLAQEQA